jgi:phosphoenolpyruvate carboxylase
VFNPQSKRKIPHVMATQHPDNAGVPFWHNDAFIGENFENDEIYQNFFHLGADEYMWDWEGKIADEAIIDKLVAKHLEDFRKKQLGRDLFVTLRIPNIWEEKTFKLARTYMSVLSAAELTRSLKLHSPPVFEFILPMTKSADQLVHIQDTFQKTAKVHEQIFKSSEFGEGYIHIIPLFESIDDLAGCARVLTEFITAHKKLFKKNPVYIRPFIARSDPALNAGFVPSVVATRMALREMYRMEKKFGVPMYPIIGTGSLPFRGGINPENIEKTLEQYEGIKTVTIQSAYRYDYPLPEVKKSLDYIKKTLAKPAKVVFSDEEFEKLKQINEIFKKAYCPVIEQTAGLVNEMAAHVPKRRSRVQHIGLFGYNRGVGKTKLPRAISFTAAWYSMGIPPEFIGTGRALKIVKTKGLLPLLEKHFFTLRWELKHAGKYLNIENLEDLASKHDWVKLVLEDILLCAEILGIEIGPQKDHHFIHRNLTSTIMLKKHMKMDFTKELVEAGIMRKSLG